jgi:ABC-2 type transport system ATP-binding protein
MAVIKVTSLVKEFKTVKKKKGLKGAFINLFKADTSILRAVNDINFKIDSGEIVGFIGPNGAGKSTTIKMLCGILHPTSGNILINGLSPHKERKKVVQNLGVVFGQRTQLNWDLRLGETFELLKRIYQIDSKVFDDNMRMMNDVLKIDEIINTPVRQLSLGQRMRGDLAAAMLHSPDILFLDEPTIGLDIQAKNAIREFILDINRKRKTTVILTTHDLGDVEKLCSRLVVINHGVIVQDAPINELIDKMAPYRILAIDLSEEASDTCHPLAEVILKDKLKISYRFNKNAITASQLIADLTDKLKIRDLSIQEPNIEDMIKELYNAG